MSPDILVWSSKWISSKERYWVILAGRRRSGSRASGSVTTVRIWLVVPANGICPYCGRRLHVPAAGQKPHVHDYGECSADFQADGTRTVNR